MQKRKLREVGTIISGATPKTTDSTNFGGDIPWITPADLSGYTEKYIAGGARNLTEKGYNSCSTQLMPANSVVFSSRAPIGYVAIAKNPLCTNQGFKSVIPDDGLDSEFLYYQLLYLRDSIREMGTGTTFKEISGKRFGEIDIAVPSIYEQQRIVARIEELFSQLDDAEATLQKAKAQLALYRQAVLKEAFDTIDGTECCIDNVCKEIKVGIVIKPTQYYVDKDGIFAFRNANVRRGYIDDCDWVMISKEGHIKNQKSEVNAGDVLISRSGANLGMASPVPDKYDGYNAIDVVIAVPDKGAIIPAYLAYYTNSPMGRSIVKRNERGAAQGHLNVTAYGRLPIVVPTLSEQQMIIEGIDAKTSVCDSIEQTVDETLQQAKAMRQSILQRVFNE